MTLEPDLGPYGVSTSTCSRRHVVETGNLTRVPHSPLAKRRGQRLPPRLPSFASLCPRFADYTKSRSLSKACRDSRQKAKGRMSTNSSPRRRGSVQARGSGHMDAWTDARLRGHDAWGHGRAEPQLSFPSPSRVRSYCALHSQPLPAQAAAPDPDPLPARGEREFIATIPAHGPPR